MAGPADILAAVDRKYNIQQQSASSEAALRAAQAGALASSTPFENALKAAQTRSTNATASTIGPLAQSSIAATNAGIGLTGAQVQETQARSGFLGAQTTDLDMENSALPEIGQRLLHRQLLQSQNPTFGAAPPPTGVATSLTPVSDQKPITRITPAVPSQPGSIQPVGGAGFRDTNGHYDPATGAWVPAPGSAPGYAKGTARVPKSKAKPMSPPMMAPGGPAPGMPPGMPAGPLPGLAGVLQAAMGATMVPGHGSGTVDTVDAKLAPGEAVVNKAGIKHIPGGRAAIAKANAKGNADVGMKPAGKRVQGHAPAAKPHFAGGTSNVPAPGQTVTSGSWGGSPPASPAPLSPLGQNTGLRLQLGMGKPRPAQ